MLFTLTFTAQAAKVNVKVPNEEYACEALLDTKKMSKGESKRIAEFQRFLIVARDPLGFLASAKKLATAKKEANDSLFEIEKAVREI